MPPLSRVGACLALLLLSAHAGADASWHPFMWAATAQPNLTSDRAAILLPVQLDGHACVMQLDTGAGTSVLYRPLLPANYAVTGERLAVARFGIGQLESPRSFMLMYDDDAAHRGPGCREHEGRRRVGTIGNDVFADGSLTLDLQNARFRFARAPAPGPAPSVPMTLMPSGNGHGLVPVIDATLADGRIVPLLFDTGSAPMELGVFRRAEWLALVGPDGARDAATLTTVAWGKPLVCRVAPILHALHIGPVVLDAHARATFCVRDIIPLFEGLAQFGLVGMVPFRDKVVTLDYVRKRLSIEAAETIQDGR